MASDGSEDHLPINDQRSRGISMRDNPGGRKGNGHNHVGNGKEEVVQHVVVLKFDDSYLRTCPGIVRFLQMVSSYRRILEGGSE